MLRVFDRAIFLVTAGMSRQEFAAIEIRRYPDGLWVTEVAPLMNYIFSLWDYLDLLKPERTEALAAFLQEKIKAAGGISITKDAGLAIGFPS